MFKYPRGMATGFLVVIVLFMSSGCSHTFKGRVIDADTKRPLEGAAVVAYWYEARGGIAGQNTRLKDVKETITDKNGEWSILGPEGRPLYPGNDCLVFLTMITGTYYTREPEFIIFKPGYCSWPRGFSIDACKGKIKPGGIGGIINGKDIEISRLSERNDRLTVLPSPDYGTIPKRRKEFLIKQIYFLRLINEERRNLGLSENKMYKELEDEK